MMVHQFTCPECGAVLKSAAGVQAGKVITCPKCKTRFAVAGDEVDEAEVIEDVETEKPAPKKTKRASAPPPAAKKRPVRAAVDDEDDEEEEDKPRPRKKAPKSAEPSGVSMTRNLIMGGVLLVLLGGGGYYFFGPGGKFNKEQQTNFEVAEKNVAFKESPYLPPPLEVFKMTPAELAKEVSADKEAASAKYTGKIIELEGEVKYASKIFSPDGFMLETAEIKATNGIRVGISCFVSRVELPKAWRLGAGQKVKVVGTASFQDLVGIQIILDRCKYELIGPSPLFEMTAQELAKEVLADPDAASKKYITPDGEKKEIIVEGEVAGFEKNKEGFAIDEITLVGEGGVTIKCIVNESSSLDLKVGYRVSIKGNYGGYFPDDKAVGVIRAFVLPEK